MSDASLVASILDELALRPSPAVFTRIAKDLSRIAKRNGKPWGWRYLHNVRMGKYPASKVLRSAMLAYLSELDGLNADVARSIPVQVYVSPGQAANLAGSYIMGHSVICEGCGARFVGNVGWRRYCGRCRPGTG